MNEESIIIKNLEKKFYIKNHLSQKLEELNVLKDISFNVKNGEVIGILGRNGSGKTTLLRTIAGVYSIDSGTIETKGILRSHCRHRGDESDGYIGRILTYRPNKLIHML